MAVKKSVSSKVSFGLEKNVAGALCYVFGWVSGLVFLMVERENKFIRFHAMQSLLVFAGLTVVSFIPVVGWILSPFAVIVGFVIWLMSVYKAYNGEEFELPIVGKIARSQLQKMK